MHSVRRRLTLVLAAGLALLFVGAGVLLDRMLRAHATEEFDDALLVRARSFVALTEQEGGRIELDYTAESMPEFERAEVPDYFEFWLDDGRVLLRSRRLGNADLPRAAGLSSSPAIRDAPLPDGRSGRLAQLAFFPREAQQAKGSVPAPQAGSPVEEPRPETLSPTPERRAVIVVVARGRERLDPFLGRIRLATFGIAGIAAVLAAVLVWRALARGFRPIDAIAAQVRGVEAEGLGARIAVPDVPLELAPIVEQVNAMLKRLDASFERERRFTGHVAHELRTPIAELRTLASVGSRWPGDEASVVRFFEDVGEVARRMERLVADLLLLARCQAGVETARGVPTDLREAVTSAWSALAPETRAVAPPLRLDVPDDLRIESDPDKLSIVLGNVLGNAASHAQPGGEVRCVARRTADGFRLDVENAAEPLSREDLDRIAEPFWRKDSARSPGEHAGLGLTLVSALATLLHLDVRFEQDPDGTFRVRLEGRALPGGHPVGAPNPPLAVS